ncbi:MAG: hypothetical protein ACXVB6_14765 [Mucilaginibacter sp.]
MTKKSDLPHNITESPTQLIYADAIISFAAGPAVTKLTLGTEASPKVHNPTITLVIPTASLLESISFIQKTLQENDQIKGELNIGVDAMKELYSKL